MSKIKTEDTMAIRNKEKMSRRRINVTIFYTED